MTISSTVTTVPKVWNYTLVYSDVLKKLSSPSAVAFEYVRMLMWFDNSSLVLGLDYKWSTEISMLIAIVNPNESSYSIPAALHFDQEKDMLAFKLIFGL